MNRQDVTRLTIICAATILTTEGTSGDDGTAGDAGTADAGTSGAGEGTIDLAALFTPEEVEARQAEATRRAALTDEQRAAEDEAKAAEAAKNAPPEEYGDFTVADGVVLDPEMLAEFRPMAKELGLSQEKAQKLVDLAAKIQQRTVDGIFAAHEERKAAWLNEAKADPEIGEDVKKWDPKDPETSANSVALRAFNTLAQGAPGLKAMVDELGIGNHPEFIRVFYRIGKNMREDTFELPGTGSGGDKSIAKTLWPSMK